MGLLQLRGWIVDNVFAGRRGLGLRPSGRPRFVAGSSWVEHLLRGRLQNRRSGTSGLTPWCRSRWRLACRLQNSWVAQHVVIIFGAALGRDAG